MLVQLVVVVFTPDAAIPDCLYGVCGQLEHLEKLIKFEVKENKS